MRIAAPALTLVLGLSLLAVTPAFAEQPRSDEEAVLFTPPMPKAMLSDIVCSAVNVSDRGLEIVLTIFSTDSRAVLSSTAAAVPPQQSISLTTSQLKPTNAHCRVDVSGGNGKSVRAALTTLPNGTEQFVLPATPQTRSSEKSERMETSAGEGDSDTSQFTMLFSPMMPVAADSRVGCFALNISDGDVPIREVAIFDHTGVMHALAGSSTGAVPPGALAGIEGGVTPRFSPFYCRVKVEGKVDPNLTLRAALYSHGPVGAPGQGIVPVQ